MSQRRSFTTSPPPARPSFSSTNNLLDLSHDDSERVQQWRTTSAHNVQYPSHMPKSVWASVGNGGGQKQLDSGHSSPHRRAHHLATSSTPMTRNGSSESMFTNNKSTLSRRGGSLKKRDPPAATFDWAFSSASDSPMPTSPSGAMSPVRGAVKTMIPINRNDTGHKQEDDEDGISFNSESSLDMDNVPEYFKSASSGDIPWSLVYAHIVKPTDTLAGLSLAYDAPASSILRANRLWANDNIQVKDVLFIPVEESNIPYNIVRRGATEFEGPKHVFSKHTCPLFRREGWIKIEGGVGTTEVLRVPRRFLSFFPSTCHHQASGLRHSFTDDMDHDLTISPTASRNSRVLPPESRPPSAPPWRTPSNNNNNNTRNLGRHSQSASMFDINLDNLEEVVTAKVTDIGQAVESTLSRFMDSLRKY